MHTEATSNPLKVFPLTPVATGAGNASPADSILEVRPSARIIIEVAGVCQAKCPYCAYNSGKERRKEKKTDVYMPVEMFKSIIARLAKSDAFIKKRIDRVYLYNWGEAFLAPLFNEYLEVLKDYGLYAVISSNFQKVAAIRQENYSVINEVLFSVSGMTQDTYGKIHGGQIDKVLANFAAFRSQLKRYSPQAKVFMSWHRYTFNEHEFWDAYKFSRTQDIGFIPSVAFLADLVELIQAAKDRLPEERKKDAKRDIFYDHMVDAMTSYKARSSTYQCPAWDDVVVDEHGKMLICCGTDSQSKVGVALETNYEQMREAKINSGMCKACKDTGVAEWAHNNHHDHNQLPWPAGGGIDFLRLKFAFNTRKVRNDVRHALNRLSFGDTILDLYRRRKRLSQASPISSVQEHGATGV